MDASIIQSRLHTLGAAIRVARQQRGWTQSNLARRAGLSPAAVMKIEGGAFNAQIGNVLTLCSILGISSDPDRHASTAAQQRHLLDLVARRKRIRKPRVDPALEV